MDFAPSSDLHRKREGVEHEHEGDHRDQIAAFLRGYTLADIKRWQLVPTSANGQPALAGYLWDEQSEAFMPYCLVVLTLRDDQIEEITAFITPETFRRFGLPESVAGS
jgi:RNA polymerase sigma-70 factor (ECF subfamily)